MYNNIFYFNKIGECGGTESFLYYIARTLKDYDVTILYQSGNIKQINRLLKYVNVIKWDNKFEKERIKCKKIFYNYNTEIAQYIDAKEHIQVLHTDYKEQAKNFNLTFKPNPIITRYIAPTEVVAKHFTEMYKLPCEVCSNPIVIDKPRKVLRLISATRLTKEKGKENIIKLANKLDKANIPYLWLIFTNDKNEIDNPNIVYMKPRLDISDFIADSDYLVQLSKQGEGFGYSVAESLILGTPVIVTNVDAFKEIGVTNENGFILDFELSNVNVQDIYKKRLKFNYTPPMSIYKDIIEKAKTKYTPGDKIAINIIKRYYDKEEGRNIDITKNTGDCLLTTKERADYLVRNGVAIYE